MSFALDRPRERPRARLTLPPGRYTPLSAMPQPSQFGSPFEGGSPTAMRRVGRYVLFEEFARGGMASVHLGRLVGAAGFSRVVAVKRVRAAFEGDDEHKRAILNEARLAARIRHPNVVQTLDIVLDAGIAHVVMEYASTARRSPSSSAEARVRGERAPIDIAVGIVADALEGLHAAHEARGANGQPLGVIHRDVSPQNVHVGVDGHARLLDFGIAKALDRTQLTAPGVVKGKIAYMAREHLGGGAPITRQADVYGAGVVLWEMLTGRRLFDERDPILLGTRVLTETIPPPSREAPEVPRVVDAIVLRATAPDPRDRYETAAEMLSALQGIPRAEASAIGAWVERLAGDDLELRAERLKRAETADVTGMPEEGTEPDVPVPRRRRGGWIIAAGIAIGVTLVVVGTRPRAVTAIEPDSRPSTPTPTPDPDLDPDPDPDPDLDPDPDPDLDLDPDSRPPTPTSTSTPTLDLDPDPDPDPLPTPPPQAPQTPPCPLLRSPLQLRRQRDQDLQTRMPALTVSGQRALPFFPALFATLAVTSLASAAPPGRAERCVDAAERGQQERDRAAFVEARASFRACAADECPALVRKDCSQWLTDLEAEPPERRRRRQGRARQRCPRCAHSSVDGRSCQEDVDVPAAPLPLDPGPHTFGFEHPPDSAFELSIIVRSGEHNRPIYGTFEQISAANRGASPRAPTPRRRRLAPSAAPDRPAPVDLPVGLRVGRPHRRRRRILRGARPRRARREEPAPLHLRRHVQRRAGAAAQSEVHHRRRLARRGGDRGRRLDVAVSSSVGGERRGAERARRRRPRA